MKTPAAHLATAVDVAAEPGPLLTGGRLHTMGDHLTGLLVVEDANATVESLHTPCANAY